MLVTRVTHLLGRWDSHLELSHAQLENSKLKHSTLRLPLGAWDVTHARRGGTGVR
jgi:hypothetical protein